MSRWTHAICEACWNKRNPDRQAARVVDTSPTECCFCGSPTGAGIFVRESPENVLCKGNCGDD